jgi:hypothetical protein
MKAQHTIKQGEEREEKDSRTQIKRSYRNKHI